MASCLRRVVIPERIWTFPSCMRVAARRPLRINGRTFCRVSSSRMPALVLVMVQCRRVDWIRGACEWIGRSGFWILCGKWGVCWVVAGPQGGLGVKDAEGGLVRSAPMAH